jgi:two-component system CheB/CheR fusion protein
MNPPRPDRAQETLAELDNIIPTRGYAMTPLVGLGGAAGAEPALRRFFGQVPRATGVAYAVVLRGGAAAQEPGWLSALDGGPLKVVRVEDRARIEPDHVYLIPAGKLVRSLGGQLVLEEAGGDAGAPVPLDLFFRTLADTHGPHSAAVVLSGPEGDGAIGIKRVKERGGLTLAQDPQEAEHGSMPRAAIATGMVDWVLPAAQMPGRLMQYWTLERQVKLPPEDAPAPADSWRADPNADEVVLRDVLALLRTRTGRDFANYKRATILRRIGRRMQVNGVGSLRDYLGCLRARPGEAAALLQDLLISVTNFFRDAECFAALERQVPQLFQGKGPGESVRVWVAACATGEEAYSVAMLLAEHAATLAAPPPVQVFATDLDEEAIHAAREGVYPAGIEADVSEERLRRFFVREHRGWRVRRELRETVLFAAHDVLKDSPFSRLDLITCRNLLIYLNREAQSRVFETFHFALVPHGRLFLGSSESVEERSGLFTVLDKKHRIYVQRCAPRTGLPPRAGPGELALALDAPAPEGPSAPGREGGLAAPPATRLPRGGDARAGSWGEVHLRLLEQLAPPSVLVDGEHDIVHLSPGAGRFLQHAGGEPSRNLLRTVHPDLRIELRAALYQAAQSHGPAQVGPVPFALDGQALELQLRVVPAGDAGMELYLVLFEPLARDGPPAVPRADSDPLARHLDRELERLKVHLRDTVEQYEASTEELKASNEELQAMNEELRSATEELETNREELQSINEELTTVNHELKNKLEELSHANSDMSNLMDATAIATVFLDRELRITRYTPSAVSLFNLIPTDLGRPLADLTTPLDYPQLGPDAQRVLERLVPVEREVGGADGSWYLARLLPYRTFEDRIAGVVLSFVDITERKQAEEVRLWLSAVVNASADAIISFALDGTILSWNGGAERTFGYAAKEAIGQPLGFLAPERGVEIQENLRRVEEGEPLEYETSGRRKDGSEVCILLSVAPIRESDGRVIGGTSIARDISEARRAQEALRAGEERLRLIVENARDYAIFSIDLERRVTSWNAGAERLLGWSEAEALGQSGDLIFTEEDRAAGAPASEVSTALAEGRAADDRVHRRKDGSLF